MRRVMGASLLQVITTITRNYLRLSLIAAGIAFPGAWYFMNKWVHVFPYNIGLPVILFILSAFVIVIIAAGTATFHSLKAVVSKPVKTLRTE